MALILDTGPIYASLDRSDDDHARCRQLIEEAGEPLLIPAPVLVEVDYLIHRSLHPGVLVALLADIESGAYEVIGVTSDVIGESPSSAIDTQMRISATSTPLCLRSLSG